VDPRPCRLCRRSCRRAGPGLASDPWHPVVCRRDLRSGCHGRGHRRGARGRHCGRGCGCGCGCGSSCAAERGACLQVLPGRRNWRRSVAGALNPRFLWRQPGGTMVFLNTHRPFISFPNYSCLIGPAKKCAASHCWVCSPRRLRRTPQVQATIVPEGRTRHMGTRSLCLPKGRTSSSSKGQSRTASAWTVRRWWTISGVS
jgi:hypothetical protein